VQAGRLALGLALLDTLPSTAPADNSATPVIKDQAALDAIVTVLSAENPTTAKPAQAIREAWQYANAASLQLALLDATLEGRIDTRQQQWVRLLLDYPDPATRPMIGTHTLVASALGLWTHPENAPSTLHIIDGILAISSSDPNDPTVVLYIPDAPDDQDLKALSRLADIDPYLVEPQWRNYLAARLKTSGTPIPQAPFPVTGAHVQLIPIPGDVQLGLYTLRRDALLEQARQSDPDTTITDRRSLIDQWALGNVVGQKSAGLIGTFLPGKNALARIRATGQPELAALPARPTTERQQRRHATRHGAATAAGRRADRSAAGPATPCVRHSRSDPPGLLERAGHGYRRAPHAQPVGLAIARQPGDHRLPGPRTRLVGTLPAGTARRRLWLSGEPGYVRCPPGRGAVPVRSRSLQRLAPWQQGGRPRR
ncbi:dermonecrotic toxin domain-containing protein, partial [Pseudomonas gingeri]|uniref:dermonecrotic toxin domain-containing protein n=1 Tax=Pseudomonas gingeri TaxID=117681 RepID=UPI00210E5E49